MSEPIYSETVQSRALRHETTKYQSNPKLMRTINVYALIANVY